MPELINPSQQMFTAAYNELADARKIEILVHAVIDIVMRNDLDGRTEIEAAVQNIALIRTML